MSLREDKAKVMLALNDYETMILDMEGPIFQEARLKDIKDAKNIVAELFARIEGLEK